MTIDNSAAAKPASVPISPDPGMARRPIGRRRKKRAIPALRLKPGGRASHFAEASLKDFTSRYGAYLGFLQRRGVLNPKAAAAAQVTRSNVNAYIVELKGRKVSSVTIWNCIYKLRRMSQLLNPKLDFGWLIEIESESALVMTPRSKFDRLVLTNRLVEAGLTLIAEAEKMQVSI